MMNIKIGVAGCGALGTIVCNALAQGIDGYDFTAVSDIQDTSFDVPNVTFNDLATQCDMVVECLPPAIVPDLAKAVLGKNKTLVMISACAMLLHPEIKDMANQSKGRLLVPSGAIAGLDAISALKIAGIDSATIATTKPPKGLQGAPHVVSKKIDLENLTEPKMIFRGNAYDAAKAFPANVNVAATLSIAGIGPDKTMVEVWADPNASGNKHEIIVTGGSSTIRTAVENLPDPTNPKSSMLAGYSIVAALKKQTDMMVVV
jgi:aspartate dehydrogenase